MIYLYEDLMQQQSKVWNRIVDIVGEIRDEDTNEIIDNLGGCQTGEYLASGPWRDINDVLIEALHSLREEQERRFETEQKMTEEQLKTFEELLRRDPVNQELRNNIS